MKKKYPRYFTLSKTFLEEGERNPWMLYSFVEKRGGVITYVKKPNCGDISIFLEKESYALECVKEGKWVEIQREELPLL